MILSAGLRTDIPAYYSEWFFNRLKEGYVYSRNPLFQNCVTEYTLSPDKVDAFYFCSKNYAPMLPRLGELKDYRTIFHATLNAYGTDLEPNLPPRQDRIDTILSLSKLVGRQRVYWRYDPILVTKEYSTDFHLEAFAELASILAPHVSGCVINFIEITREIERRLPERLTCTRTDRRTLLMGLGSIGKRLGLPIRICGRGEDFSAYGISRGGCVNLDDIALANDCTFKKVRHLGNRRRCDCINCRDIGAYDSCPAGCLYCNATKHPDEVEQFRALHDPNGPILIGTLSPEDRVTKSPQESFLHDVGGQISFFDP